MISPCHAGYVLPAFHDALSASGLIGEGALRELWRTLCIAECESTIDLSGRKQSEDPVLLTAANLVSRGLPTLPSVAIEKFFAESFHRCSIEADDRGVLRSRPHSPGKAFLPLLLRALQAVAVPTDKELQTRLGKSKAASLLKPMVPLFRQLFGAASLQLLDSDEKRGCLQLPFLHRIAGIRGVRALAIAKEGSSEKSGLHSDGWYHLVVTPGGSAQLQKDVAEMKRLLTPGYPAKMAADAGELSASAEGREVLQLIRSPLGAGRIQRALLQVVIAGGLDLSVPSWSLTIVERDVPCGALAVAEFVRLMEALFSLEGKDRTLPAISTRIVPSSAFADSKLHKYGDAVIVRDGAKIPPADLLIDVALLSDDHAMEPTNAAEARIRLALRNSRKLSEPRRFHLTEATTWKPLSINGSRDIDPEVRRVINSFLADLFRLSRVSGEQLRLLDHVLQNRSFLAALPAMSGKSLPYQFAGLLQPALSFALFPLAALAVDQTRQLQDVFIDGAEFLHEGMGTDARNETRARFRNREALFLLTTEELFRSEEIGELLESMQKEKVHFSQCVIDEAQCMSDWSHDPRPGMHRAPGFLIERLNAGKKKSVAVRLLTAAVSRDVIADLRWQMAGLGAAWSLQDDQCVVGASVLQPQQHFEVVFDKVSNADTQAALNSRQNGTARALAEQRTRFLAAEDQAPALLRVPGAQSERPLSTVVYCPYSSGTLGVTNRYAAGVSDAAVEDSLKGTGHAIGTYIGKDDSRSRVGRHSVNDAIAQGEKFRNGSISLLLATRAYGIGTQKSDTRCTLHLLPPPGVERLVQECGRAGRDGKFALHTILHSGQSRDGQSLELRLGLDILRAAASDAAREKQLIHDLLEEITYPEDSNTNRVANLIADEFGIDARISYWQRGLEERMYAQYEGAVFGYIDLVTQDIVAEPKYPDQTLAREILEFAFATSIEAAGSGPSLSSWVAATFAADIDDGITRQMQDFDPGAVFTLRIGYENDREPLLTQIHQILWRQAEIEIQRKIFSDVHGQSWSDFREQLIIRSGQPDLLEGLDPAIDAKLVAIYNKIRTRTDTKRILTRLATLGVLHDYQTHPASRKFSMRIAVRADHEIRTSLEQYYTLFLPTRSVESRLAALQSYPGDSFLEQCLNSLIDFSYEYCYQRRLEGAGMMDRLCRSAKDDPAFILNEQIERALVAKYSLPHALPAALEKVSHRLELLGQYAELLESDRSGSMRENAAQLAASCNILASSYGDEPALPLLRNFAEMMNADGEKRKSLQKEFARSYADAASASGLQGENYLSQVAGFEATLQRFFADGFVAQLLSLLHDEVKRVKAMPLPAAVSAETRAAQKAAAAKRAAEQKADEQKAAAQKAAEQKAAAQKAYEQKAAAQKADEQKIAAQKAAEQKAAEQKAAEQKAAEQKAAEQKAAEQKAAEQKRSEQKRSEQLSGRDAQNQLPASEVDSSELDDLEQILADLENALQGDSKTGTLKQNVDSGRESADKSKSAGVRHSTTPPAPDRQPVVPEVDPNILTHLKWLQSFNHTFLKHYES